MIDFSKGPGAPFVAILAGSAKVIADARRIRQMLGGGLRQAGIMAAGARYALEHNIARLADDHARARLLAEGLAELPAVALALDAVQTNIVVFQVPDAHAFCAALEERGVRMCQLDRRRVRAVTHLDIDDRAINRALTGAREIALS